MLINLYINNKCTSTLVTLSSQWFHCFGAQQVGLLAVLDKYVTKYCACGLILNDYWYEIPIGDSMSESPYA